jgi:cyclopropane fatty-acyl-phospholipid synthase-like methyltransferase
LARSTSILLTSQPTTARPGFDPTEELVLLRELGLGEQSTLVDLGAGTGTLALAAAAHCRKVVAVDVSAEMVAATKKKKKAIGLGVANVECVHAGFLSYQRRGVPVDFVYSRNALHHLPEFWKAVALERVSLMLRPGGILRLRDIVWRAVRPQDTPAEVGVAFPTEDDGLPE